MSTEETVLQDRIAAAGDAAPPMENGELLFAEPWEARAFGMAHRLCDAGCFPWDAFRDHLIAEIGRWDSAHPDGADYRYYERWLAALERTLADAGLAGIEELADRSAALAARPHGHDH
jgi:nitrile hydratase accessory protein